MERGLNLYRMTVEGWVYSPRVHKAKGTYYVIQPTEQEAIDYLKSHLRPGMEIKGKCAHLGEYYGDRLYGPGDKGGTK